MMHEFVIGGGQITCIQQDDIDLTELGKVTNERASDVSWDEGRQLWVAIIRSKFRHGSGPHWFAHKSRAKCIEWEKKYLNCENLTERKVTA